MGCSSGPVDPQFSNLFELLENFKILLKLASDEGFASSSPLLVLLLTLSVVDVLSDVMFKHD